MGLWMMYSLFLAKCWTHSRCSTKRFLNLHNWTIKIGLWYCLMSINTTHFKFRFVSSPGAQTRGDRSWSICICTEHLLYRKHVELRLMDKAARYAPFYPLFQILLPILVLSLHIHPSFALPWACLTYLTLCLLSHKPRVLCNAYIK